jgi:predicted nucleotidyltransferase
MELLVEMRYGSHLYGTDTPQSDIDLKSVYLPEARDILLQRVHRHHAAQAAGTKKRPRRGGSRDV